MCQTNNKIYLPGLEIYDSYNTISRCDDQCHRGDCRSCPNVSFDELPCQCGAQVAFPPIQCGAKPPQCDRTCTRNHECTHPVR